MKNSGLGIASFIISIVTGILIFVLFLVAGVMEASTPGGMNEKSVTAVILGLLIFAALFLCLVTLGLGIAGLMQKERKKTFATLGIIFSTVILLGTSVLLIIGVSMGK